MESDCLSALKPMQTATITEVLLHGADRRRVYDLGFQPGSHVRCTHLGPGGSPVAFLVNSAQIALRESVCRQILAVVHG